MYRLEINRDAKERALKSFRDAKERFMLIDEEIANLPEVTLANNGVKSVAEREELLQKYQAEKDKISIRARLQIESARKDYNDFIKAQTTPNGTELESGDAQIIMQDLIVDEAELLEIASKHADSEIFRRLVETYAKEHGFEMADFYNITNEEGVQEYGKVVFDLCSNAVCCPVGSYSDLYLSNEDAMTELAVKCGIQ